MSKILKRFMQISICILVTEASRGNKHKDEIGDALNCLSLLLATLLGGGGFD